MIYDELWHSISYYESKKKKLKKYEKDILKIINILQNKLSFLVRDIIDNGKTYRLEDNKSILEKKSYYVVKKTNMGSLT